MLYPQTSGSSSDNFFSVLCIHSLSVNINTRYKYIHIEMNFIYIRYFVHEGYLTLLDIKKIKTAYDR